MLFYVSVALCALKTRTQIPGTFKTLNTAVKFAFLAHFLMFDFKCLVFAAAAGGMKE